MSETLTYQGALEELLAIQHELENNTVAVDVLSTKIERAYFLLNFCKDKLRDAENHIDRIIDANLPQK